ncbi:MAG: HAD family phosphatase [Flavobacteriaceae bacterium]
MIKNIVFDFGDVFINLDKLVVINAMRTYGISELTTDFDALNKSFEVGAISPDEFLNELHGSFSTVSKQEIERVWNAMLLDLPDYRLQFLEDLAAENNYRLFLLSNTNALHIPHVQEKMGQSKYSRFKNSFEGFHLSHDIHLR